jgi:membrane-bound serine protease (ClpP class)
MQTLRLWMVALVCVLGFASAGRAQAGDPVPVSPPPDEAPAPGVVVEAPALPATVAKPDGGSAEPTPVLVIPVRDAISKPILYVIRRGLKEAKEAGVGAVVLDMETPGGELGVTLEIMEALDKFDGETMVYVNKEAISAGAIISSVTDEIHFAPGAVIGAAAAVSGGGEEIAETMKQKINSYLNAKVRSFSAGKGHRSEVIRAMMDADFEFKIGDTVIKPKGELLSLTAEEAAKTYGEPAIALLSSGTHDTLEAMLGAKYGTSGYAVKRLEVTWSEELAAWLANISPLLMGLGLLCVYVEFKTPGFGVFGITGGVLLAIVFFGHYTAGLSGHEAALVFGVGLVLVAVEIFLFPGTLVAGLTGAVLMLGALVWSMVDVWPGEMPALDRETFFRPMLNVALAIGVALVTALALGRFLPRGWFWDKMVLSAAVAGDAGAPAGGMGFDGGFESAAPEGGDGLLGARGKTVSVLRPMGEVEIAGRRHEARASLGSLERGESVRVVGRSGRTLIVEGEVA